MDECTKHLYLFQNFLEVIIQWPICQVAVNQFVTNLINVFFERFVKSKVCERVISGLG